jgi:cohesin loading factor subunit SCC2
MLVCRCSTREEDNDYRQLLANFVEDLLMTINLPEWPASQVLLRVLSGILLKNVKKDSKESTVLKTFSIEILGNVTAKVKKEMALAQQWMEVLPGHMVLLHSLLTSVFWWMV